MYKRSSDLLIVAAAAIVGMVAALSGANNLVIGALFGLPLALALPGYALIAAGAPSGALGPAEHLTFSVGGSIAVSVLGGFALNLTPWGLRPDSWALLLGGLTLAACAVALLRRQAIAPAPAAAWVRLRLRDIGLFGLAALVAAGAFVVAIDGAAQLPAQGFTQLWMLPADDGVRIGVQNLDSQTMRYTVELAVGGQVMRRWESIELQRNARWETAEPFQARAGAPVEARLYRFDDPKNIYRQVALQSSHQ